MKRAATAVLVLILAGCGNSASVAPVYLAGLADVALVNDLLFTNSTDTAELRVLNLTASPFRDFVRAPNPLEPLSIPVTERPVELARDVHYGQLGDTQDQLIPGPYVYARSAALPEISVVDSGVRLEQDTSTTPSKPILVTHSVADVTIGLREVVRIHTDAPVTAVAAQGPKDPSGSSRLFFATTSGSQSKVWYADIAPPDTSPFPEPVQVPLGFTPDAGEQVSALLPIPDPQNPTAPPHQVVIALRSDGGFSGRTIVYDLNGAAADIPLHFSATPRTDPKLDVPVRKLRTNAGFARVGESAPFNPGRLIYAVLDESFCISPNRLGGDPCQGVLAADLAPTATGKSPGDLAQDVTGADMLPIPGSKALVQGFDVSPKSVLAAVDANGTLQAVNQLGVVATSDDNITEFDATTLRGFDANPNPPTLSAVTLQHADGTSTASIPPGTGPGTIEVAEGAVRNETISITNQAVLPGLASLGPITDTTATVTLQVSDAALSNVELNDIVQLSADGTPCPTELTVASAAAGVITASGPVPGDCKGTTITASIRANGTDPYVVTGTDSGFMGRTHPGTTSDANAFRFGGTYFFHENGFPNPGGVPAGPVQAGHLMPDGKTQAQVFMTFNPDVDPTFGRDDSYQFTTTSGFLPLSFGIDTTGFNAGATMPGGATVWAPADTTLGQFIYVAFPSRNGIMEASPQYVLPGVLNGSNLHFYP